jgi:hypothetical protein
MANHGAFAPSFRSSATLAIIAIAGNLAAGQAYAQGTISLFAGSGPVGNAGNGGPAISATFGKPAGLTVDKSATCT